MASNGTNYGITATDNGFVGFGVQTPNALADVKAVDNGYAASKPSINLRYDATTVTPQIHQTLQYIIKPDTSLNPAALGSRAIIFDNDGIPSTSTGGLYIGTNSSNGKTMGITMGEKIR